MSAPLVTDNGEAVPTPKENDEKKARQYPPLPRRSPRLPNRPRTERHVNDKYKRTVEFYEGKGKIFNYEV